MPPQLAVFDVADWWVDDPQDPVQLGYARITCACARRAYAAGENWRSFMQPPAWLQEQGAPSLR